MNAQTKARESCGTHIPLLALALFCLIGLANPTTTVSACGFLNTANETYVLNQSISTGASDCITFNATNQTLNCAGFWVNTTGYNSAVSSTFNQSKVSNCNIKSASFFGVFLNGAHYSTITNTSVLAPGGTALQMTAGDFITVTNSTFNGTVGITTRNHGIFTNSTGIGITNAIIISSQTSNNTFNGCTAIDTSTYALQISRASNNTFINGAITGQAATGAINIYDNSIGNIIANNTINAMGSTGIGFVSVGLAGRKPNNNTIANNTITNASTSLKIDNGASGNTFYLNNFSNTGMTPTYYINDTNGSNFYNATVDAKNQGNIYGNIMDWSVVIPSSGVVSSIPPLQLGSVAYNNSSSLGKFLCNFAGCADYAPLVNPLNITSLSTFSNPQYDLVNDNLTLTVYAGYSTLGAMSSNVTYNGTTYSVDCTLTGTNYTCSKVVTPPTVTAITSMAINWSFSIPLISYTNTTNNATDLYPSGLIYCGNLSNTTSLNISIKDIQTGALINSSAISMITTYTGSSKVSSFSSTNSSNLTLCILPNTTFSTSNTVLATATGYYQNSLTDAFSVSNNQTNKTYYLLNISNAYTTVLKVITSPNLLTEGVKISIYSFNAPSTYALVTSCTTDAGGQCSIYLQTGIQQYVFNFTSGLNYSFGPEILSCTGATCYRTFTVGSAGSIPIQLTGVLSGSCVYTNTTRIAQCTGADTSSTLTSFTLVANRLGNQTLVCNTTSLGSSATIICTLPNICGLYSITFYGNDVSGNTYSLSGATVTTSACSTTTGYGREGWIALLILFGTIAMIGFYNIAVSMTLGAAGLLLGLLLGIIPFDMNSVIFVSITTMGAILAYRSKV